VDGILLWGVSSALRISAPFTNGREVKVVPSTAGRAGLRIGLVALLVGSALLMAGPTTGFAAGVGRLVYNPSPIGTPNTVPVNHVVSITLSVEDSGGGLIPFATVYIGFLRANGGGTASVSGGTLNSKPQPEAADSSGHITISYTTPPTFPSFGCDVVHTQDKERFNESSVKKDDSFCFSTITSIGFTPTPIAPARSLGPNTHVPVTVSVFGTGGTPYGNAMVWITFRATTGGGTATINGVKLTRTPTPFTTNAIGEIFIDYSTPSHLPTSGADRIIAADGARAPAVFAADPYRY
jgi:hypothetical protein